MPCNIFDFKYLASRFRVLTRRESVILTQTIDVSGGPWVQMRNVIFIALGLALTGCAHLAAPVTEVSTRDPAAAKSAVAGTAPETPSEINKILEDTNPLLSEVSEGGEKVPLQIPIEINRKVSQWINFFTVRERDMTQRYFERGEALRPRIEAILKENEVPPELYYLAMIESGFVTHAKSRAKAVGVWQFMTGTGKNYGLQVNKKVDERRNWIKSTEAAASYLKDLHNVFGSWYLALAAYNAGEHRIVRSIMKGKTRDFWALAEAGLLPKETLDYVPKFLAAHIVGKNMKRFGFNVQLGPEDIWEPYETATVPSGARLADLARVTDIPIATLKRWNYDLVAGFTPVTKSGTVDIYVPKGMAQKFEQQKDVIAQLKHQKPSRHETRIYADSAPAATNTSYEVYVVRHGDNLYTISKHIGISVRTLMKINGIRRGRIHPGQRLKYYNAGTTSAQAPAKRSRRLASTKSKGGRN
jgi:membrane-bound lytic murein transglycosylase D